MSRRDAATGIEALMAHLHRTNRLLPHHVWAGRQLIRTLRAAEGQSYGVIDPTAAHIGGNGSSELPYVIGRMESEELLRRLRSHERETVNFMVLYKDVKGANLAQFGRERSTYQDRESASAYAMGRILATLDSVCEIRGYERRCPG